MNSAEELPKNWDTDKAVSTQVFRNAMSQSLGTEPRFTPDGQLQSGADNSRLRAADFALRFEAPGRPLPGGTKNLSELTDKERVQAFEHYLNADMPAQQGSQPHANPIAALLAGILAPEALPELLGEATAEMVATLESDTPWEAADSAALLEGSAAGGAAEGAAVVEQGILEAEAEESIVGSDAASSGLHPLRDEAGVIVRAPNNNPVLKGTMNGEDVSVFQKGKGDYYRYEPNSISGGTTPLSHRPGTTEFHPIGGKGGEPGPQGVVGEPSSGGAVNHPPLELSDDLSGLLPVFRTRG